MNDQPLQPSFTVSEVLNESHKRLKGNWLRYFILMLFVLILSLPAYVIDWYAQYQASDAISAVSQIVSFFLSGIITIGMTRFALEVVDGKKSDFMQLFNMNWRMYGSVLLASVLFVIVVGLGMIALIIPGIILALMLCLFAYLIVEKNAGPVQALQWSAQLTKGNKANMFVVWFALFGLAIAAVGVPFALAAAVGIILATQAGTAGIVISIIVGLAALIVMFVAVVYLSALQTIAMAYIYRRASETRKLA